MITKTFELHGHTATFSIFEETRKLTIVVDGSVFVDTDITADVDLQEVAATFDEDAASSVILDATNKEYFASNPEFHSVKSFDTFGGAFTAWIKAENESDRIIVLALTRTNDEGEVETVFQTRRELQDDSSVEQALNDFNEEAANGLTAQVLMGGGF